MAESGWGSEPYTGAYINDDFKDVSSRIYNDAPLLFKQFQQPIPEKAAIDQKLKALRFVQGGDHERCKQGFSAFTTVGGDKVGLCDVYSRSQDEEARRILLEHELLHTLGLPETPGKKRKKGEPPTPDEINRAVMKRFGRGWGR